MAQSASGLAAKAFFVDLIGGVLAFPLWWYTRGLAQVSASAAASVKNAAALLSLGVWAKNLFVPMYGDDSFAGRAISFGIRLVMVIARGFGVLAWALLVGLLWVLYIVAIPLAVIGLLYHGLGSLFV